jgi:colicin import membrane protein
MASRSHKISFAFAVGLHMLMLIFLVMSLERTIVIQAEPAAPKTEIIDAVMINKKTLQEEVARLEAKEAKKRAIELEKQQEIVRQQKEAQQKREKEEALAVELIKKNEELKKQAEALKVAEQQKEKEHQAKLKKEQEELKKQQKEKEQALAEKKKAEEQQAQKQKEAEQVEQANQVNPKVRQDQITFYAKLMRNKIHQNWRQPIGFDFGGFTCKIAVKLMPTGEVIDATVIESSGNVEFDRSTELAIRKASPLPMPEDPHIAKEFHSFTFTFRPEAV